MSYHVIALDFNSILIFYIVLYLFFNAFRIGPMNTQLNQRRASVCRKRVRPTENVHPAEVRIVDQAAIIVYNKNDGRSSVI